MKQLSKRVQNFINGFMEEHQKGFSVIEIAEHFGISAQSGYNILDEIAKKYGVEREVLLQKKPYKERIDKGITKAGYGVNMDDLRDSITNLTYETENMLDALRSMGV